MVKKVYLFLIFVLWAKVSFAMHLIQKMNVQIGVFDAARVLFQYRQDDKNFEVNAKVDTVNLFSSLYPFTATYESFGLISENDVVPQKYYTQSRSRNHIRHKEIFYTLEGRAYKRVSSKDKVLSNKNISDTSKTADAADLQSVFAKLIWRFNLNKQCDFVREIDDGKKHYNLISKDGGEERRYFETLQSEGVGHLCLVYFKNLKKDKENSFWGINAERPIKLWIGEDKSTKLPFVLEIGIDSTPLGELKVIPSTFEIR